LSELVREPLDAALGFVDRVAVLLQRDVLRRDGEAEIGQPAAIRARPAGASGIASTLAEQERLQPVLRLCGQADGIFAGADEIAQGFIIGRRDVDGGQLASTMQPGQSGAITSIRLDPITAPLRHARGIDDDAVFSLAREIAVDPEPAGAHLMHKPQPPARRTQRPDGLGHGLQVTRDRPVVPELAVSSLLGETSIDSLWTSIPTNMLRFAMACLRCVWHCAVPSSASRIHEYNVRQVS
jgi:hypothetical protein